MNVIIILMWRFVHFAGLSPDGPAANNPTRVAFRRKIQFHPFQACNQYALSLDQNFLPSLFPNVSQRHVVFHRCLSTETGRHSRVSLVSNLLSSFSRKRTSRTARVKDTTRGPLLPSRRHPPPFSLVPLFSPPAERQKMFPRFFFCHVTPLPPVFPLSFSIP